MLQVHVEMRGVWQRSGRVLELSVPAPLPHTADCLELGECLLSPPA